MRAGIRERLPGIDPWQFWQAAAPRACWSAMAEKYRELAAACGENSEDQRRVALREAARRWPGSLREAELIGPARLDERRRAAEAGDAGQLGLTRADALTSDRPEAPAVLLWAALHPLLADLQRFRGHRRVTGGAPGASEAFADWIAADPEATARWPAVERLAACGETPRAASLGLSAEGGVAETRSTPGTTAFRLLPLDENPGAKRCAALHHGLLAAVIGPTLRVRGAYLWLAARAGLDLPTLNACLFARAGHWDRREGDPDWAHPAARSS